MSSKTQMRKVLKGLAPPPKPRLIERRKDPKHMPMDFTTPVAEIVRRWSDESERCNRWAMKHLHNTSIDLITEGMQDNLVKYLSRDRLKLAGMSEWKSPVTGDKWIALVFRKDLMNGMTDFYAQTMYYWETVGSFGVAFERNMPRADDVESYNPSVWMFNNHCIQRFKERTGVTGSTINLILFLYAVIEYSAGYQYNRCGKQCFEIATEFGVFRMDAQYKHEADHVKTFIAKEQLPEIDRKRYDHYWEIAKKHIFTNPKIMKQ